MVEAAQKLDTADILLSQRAVSNLHIQHRIQLIGY